MRNLDAKMFGSTHRAPPAVRIGFAPVGSRSDAAALVIVVALSFLFAAAIVAATQPAHVVDPVLASLQGGL